MATIKKAQNGTVKYSDPRPIFEKLRKSKDSIDNAKLNLINKKRKTEAEFKTKMENLKKKMKNGGSLSALNASNKRDKGTDVGGAYTIVQKKALAGAKGKASLTKDKQLGATKMQNGGSVGSKVVKENPRQQKRLSRIKENNPERAERVEKRMVKRADRAMGARGAASRMKSGGSVKKK
jgi:hypothetical protein